MRPATGRVSQRPPAAVSEHTDRPCQGPEARLAPAPDRAEFRGAAPRRPRDTAARRAVGLDREGRELDQLPVELEPSAEHPGAVQPDIDPEARSRTALRRRLADLVDEPVDPLGPGRARVHLLERVEQVPGAQLGPQGGEGIRARDGVEAERVPEAEDGAALPRQGGEGSLEARDRPPVGGEGVVVRRGRRGDLHPVELLVHRAPDLALRAPRARPRAASAWVFARRSSAFETWPAAEKSGETERHLPCSTHDTGIASFERAATSTLTSRIRFCFAPTSSSPS